MAVLSEKWIYTLADLEATLGGKRFPSFVEECENRFRRQLDEVAGRIAHDPAVRFVFVSGPTSSGKTTFTTHLTAAVNASGRKAYLMSLDDYYFEGPVSYDECGRPDMDSIQSIEVDLVRRDLNRLAAGEQISPPTFRFGDRIREFHAEKRYRLGEGDIVLIEGLHALSPEVIRNTPREQYVGVFLMPNAELLDDNRTLSRDDLRKLRRVSRDVAKRGAPALATLDYWPMISRNEEEFIQPYLERADFYLNTALPYEFSVIAPSANRHLQNSIAQYMRGELPPSRNVRKGLFYADLNRAIQDARRLSKVCELIPEVSTEIIPQGSILQEFI